MMNFENDKLERLIFADKLIRLSTIISNTNILPAGRVIAVDAPWGSGKSWIAKQLPKYFKSSSEIGGSVYIDAFEFDFHQDPFVVVASAILQTYDANTVVVKNFKTTATDIMRTALPAIGKGVIKTGGKLLNIDAGEIYESIIEAGSEASEKAIEKMLDTFSNTSATTIKFKEKLTELARINGQNKPLVIIIDELDRCRPSFALEMLERIKHLFDVENVVFILFMHKLALHSAINKTYGASINAEEYLKKFISLTIGLPDSRKANPTKDDLRKLCKTQPTAESR